MKTTFFTTIIAAMFVTVISCKSKSQKDAEDYKNKIEETMKEKKVLKTVIPTALMLTAVARSRKLLRAVMKLK